jgi:hypothetical protein
VDFQEHSKVLGSTEKEADVTRHVLYLYTISEMRDQRVSVTDLEDLLGLSTSLRLTGFSSRRPGEE